MTHPTANPNPQLVRIVAAEIAFIEMVAAGLDLSGSLQVGDYALDPMAIEGVPYSAFAWSTK